MMVKNYKSIFGYTGAPVHELIVEGAITLLPEKIQAILSEKIDGPEAMPITTINEEGEWRILKKFEEPVTLGALIREGARAEDESYCAKKYWIDDTPVSTITGENLSSLAHYWNYGLYKKNKVDRGLLPEEHVRTFLWWLPGVNLLVKKLLQELSSRRAPYPSALSRAIRYWEGEIHLMRKDYSNARVRSEMYEMLGRVTHLLTDVGVPAHIHCDTHIPFFDPDQFELNVGSWMNESRQVWKANSYMKPIFDRRWTDLTQMFSTFADVSILFDSDDVDGFGKGQPFRWGERKYRLGRSGYLGKYACKKIGDVILPLNFQFIAGIILFFFREFFPTLWKENEDEFLRFSTNTIEFPQ